MLEVWYELGIQPIEYALRKIFELYLSLHSSPGLSIILLSITFNIIILPIYILADSIQKKEYAIIKNLQPSINKIKQSYTGSERFFYIKTLYRQNKYHPAQSIRSSLGLFLQVPFFIAAYALLSNAQEIKGVAFLWLSNLGQPDQLLSNINLLPVVMFVTNLVAGYIYFPKPLIQHHIQLWAIACIFLVLLYNSPSGLVLYWTCNNMFYIAKNILIKYGADIGKSRIKPTAIKSKVHYFISILVKEKKWILRTLFALAVACLYVYTQTRSALSTDGLFYGITGLLALHIINTLALRAHFQKPQANVFFLSIQAFFISIVSITAFILLFFNPLLPSSESYLLAENTIYVSLVILALFGLAKAVACIKIKGSTNRSVSTFMLCSVAFLATYFLVIPQNLLYSTDQLIIEHSYFYLQNLGRFTFFCLLAYTIYSMASPQLRVVALYIIFYALTIALFYSFGMVRDFGLLVEFQFEEPERLQVNSIEKVIEYIILLLVLPVVCLWALKHKRVTNPALATICFMLLSSFAFNYQDQPLSQRTHTTEDVLHKKTINKNYWNLSQDKNILIILTDGFSGTLIDHIKNKNPNFLKDYMGFVWYPNTVASGTNTWSSIAAVSGGSNFTVESINARSKEKYLSDEYNAAYEVFPRHFSKNWDFAYHFPQQATYLHPRVEKITENYAQWFLQKQQPGILKNIQLNDELSMLMSVSVFRMLPLSAKEIFYGNGNWGKANNTKAMQVKLYKKAQHWGLLHNFIDTMQADNPMKTFRFIQLSIPHTPNFIREDGLLHHRSQYTIEASMVIQKIGEILQALRSLNIYDQTKIIIVSDHGYSRFQTSSRFASHISKYPIPPQIVNALLMVKDFNASGELREDNHLMSNMDVPALACTGISDQCNLTETEPHTQNTQRKVQVVKTRKPTIDKDMSFNVSSKYEITNSIFDPSNWKRIP